MVYVLLPKYFSTKNLMLFQVFFNDFDNFSSKSSKITLKNIDFDISMVQTHF